MSATDAFHPATTVLTVSYDGAAFHGFARQAGGVQTVQGRLEDALRIALHREVLTACAGRTDAGVHGLGQVVSFPAAPGDPDPGELLRSVSALAGPDIAVRETRLAVATFDARHSALAREYRYRIATGPVPPLFISRHAWWVRADLDLEAMRLGATELLGEHDFRSFCVALSAEGKRTVREVDLLELATGTELGEPCVTVRVKGRSFLHSMVRIVVGSLVEVGRGRRAPEWVAEALAACDRSAAGPTAPPQGLTLWDVDYPEGSWL